MSSITCKFGGTSLADAGSIRQAENIIRSDERRRFIVPSAPGKRHREDKKITDLLYAWHSLVVQDIEAPEPARTIAERFEELAVELGVNLDVSSLLDEIATHAKVENTADFMASRGEYLNGRLIAKLLDATFVDPAECIKFDSEGKLDPVTYELLGDRLKGEGLFVIPGFYGSTPDGKVKTFSRGGSDITGAIVARASNSELYENWTDVSGFRMADPSVVAGAKRIEEITYKELRELAYMGARVLHDEAIFPVLEPGIPINIRNTKEPDSPGTMILPSRVSTRAVCGIAGRKGFTMINIEKTLMNHERGFGRKVLAILEEYGISFEHMPSGIDTVSLIVADEELGNHAQAIMEDIERICRPDRTSIASGLALIATVGQGMNHHLGVAARLCGALAEAKINIRVIDQGSSEMNIIVGVVDSDLEKAIKAIYDSFESWK
jgi:aspartate kinase